MLIFLVFVFGLIAGSFLNVIIYRLKIGRSLIFGRSFCPECKIKIKWHDLLPVFSFFWLKRQCRHCGRKISWQYPIVEILSGLIWVGVFYKIFGFEPFINPFLIKEGIGVVLNFTYYLFVFSALLVIAVYDYKWQIIPDKITFPAIAAALIYNAVNANFIMPFVISSVAFLVFFLIYFFSQGRAMGLGDAKLVFLIGLFLNLTLSLTAFTFAFTIGAMFGIILLAFTDKNLKSQIAFGPFLVIGTAISFFFSDFIVRFLN